MARWKYVDRLAQKRGPGESYSDVILRLAGECRPFEPAAPPFVPAAVFVA